MTANTIATTSRGGEACDRRRTSVQRRKLTATNNEEYASHNAMRIVLFVIDSHRLKVESSYCWYSGAGIAFVSHSIFINDSRIFDSFLGICESLSNASFSTLSLCMQIFFSLFAISSDEFLFRKCDRIASHWDSMEDFLFSRRVHRYNATGIDLYFF